MPIYRQAEPELSPVAEKLLGIIEARRGEKLTRNDIAKALDKPRLNPHELEKLEELGKSDKIAIDVIPQGKRTVWLYYAI